MINDIQQLIDDFKGIDIVVIDVTGKSSITDTLMITTGTSRVHVKTIADKISESYPVRYSEGLDDCEWVVLDIGDMMVHIMSKEARDYYRLEDIWDADL